MRGHVQALLTHFDRWYATFLITPETDESAASPLSSSGPHFRVPLSPGFAPGSDMRVTWRLYRLLRQARPALLHMHGFKAALTGVPAAALARVPNLVTVHNYLAHPGAGAVFPLLKRLPKAAGTRYITVSHALAREIAGWGIPAERITVIHNGIDPEPFEQAGRNRGVKAKPAGQVVVGAVARLAPQKGLTYLVRAAAMLTRSYPGMRFVVVGEGPLRQELQETACRLGLDGRLAFPGFRTDLPEQLSRMDIFVMPSLTEGLGVILLEALAAGCAVVATRVGGVPEVIEDGVTGLLVSPADTAALARAVATLVENPALARQLARAGRDRVRERFSLSKMLASTAAVYEDVFRSTRSLAGEG